MEYHHGCRVKSVTDGSRRIQTIDSGVIGVVCTAADADASKFPLNTPVLVTDVQTAVGKAGSKGTLARTLDAIVDQANAATVVVRVEEGASEAETTTNLIGGATPEGKLTGMKALLAAQNQIGVKPRILAVPGLDSQAVATELAGVAQKLRAFAYCSAYGAKTLEEAIAYRNGFGQRELMIIWPDFLGWDTTTNGYANMAATARAVGLRAKIDNEVSWSKTLSNVGVNGVTGISHDVWFDLQDPTSETDLLNSKDVTTLVNRDGYRFWGSRTCSEDPNYAFESFVRTDQIIADTIAEAHLWAIDKRLSPGLAKDIVDGVNVKLREYRTKGDIIGGEAFYDERINTKESLYAGILAIKYEVTPCPPLEDLEFQAVLSDTYFADFAKRVATA